MKQNANRHTYAHKTDESKVEGENADKRGRAATTVTKSVRIESFDISKYQLSNLPIYRNINHLTSPIYRTTNYRTSRYIVSNASVSPSSPSRHRRSRYPTYRKSSIEFPDISYRTRSSFHLIHPGITVPGMYHPSRTII